MNFAEVYKIYSVSGKISLRRWQFKMAEKNVTMAIFLGKQYLGQTDKTETEVSILDESAVQEIEAMIDAANNEKEGD